ncbi:MAG: hypothetical protein RLY16_1020 [Bacteroidota bacterium]
MRTLSLICVFYSTFSSCEQTEMVNTATTKSQDATKKEENRIIDSTVVLFSTGNVRVYSNARLRDSTIYVAERFQPFITFDDYKVHKKYSGKKSPINFQSHPLAREFRTVITNTYKNSDVTFAGHYSFITWGCGMPCQGSAIVDLINGAVYEGLHAQSGFSYKSDSRMLIVNPPDSSGFYDPTSFHGIPEIWIWEERLKRFVQKRSD